MDLLSAALETQREGLCWILVETLKRPSPDWGWEASVILHADGGCFVHLPSIEGARSVTPQALQKLFSLLGLIQYSSLQSYLELGNGWYPQCPLKTRGGPSLE